MILQNRFCRVWQAPQELMDLLPPEKEAPKHRYRAFQQIDIEKKHGLKWITCVTCDWHDDWEEVFEFLVVKGRARLHVRDPIVETCSIRRGTIIQLWPMMRHRVTVFGDAAMIELSGEEKPEFKSKEDQEATFTNYIRENYRH